MWTCGEALSDWSTFWPIKALHSRVFPAIPGTDLMIFIAFEEVQRSQENDHVGVCSKNELGLLRKIWLLDNISSLPASKI